MTGEPAKNYHGVCIGPLSKILAVKSLMTWIWVCNKKILTVGFTKLSKLITYFTLKTESWTLKISLQRQKIYTVKMRAGVRLC